MGKGKNGKQIRLSMADVNVSHLNFWNVQGQNRTTELSLIEMMDMEMYWNSGIGILCGFIFTSSTPFELPPYFHLSWLNSILDYFYTHSLQHCISQIRYYCPFVLFLLFIAWSWSWSIPSSNLKNDCNSCVTFLFSNLWILSSIAS